MASLANNPIRTITLFCWILEVSNQSFSVSIEDSRTVDDLKEAILKKKQTTFAHVEADELTIWRESIPIDKALKNNVTQRQFLPEDALPEARRLSKVFPRPEPAEETLHIVVQCPTVASRSLQSSTIKLNSWVEGDDPTQTFTVEIQKDSNISALREVIKEKKKPLFDSVPADTLQLFKLDKSLPFVQLAEFQQNDVTPLDNPTTSVSELFSQQPLDSAQLHIFVKRPSIASAPARSSIFTLNCWVLFEGADRVFPVEIAGERSVGALKKAIKEEKKPDFDRIPADKLTLWKVSIPRERRQDVLKNCKGPKFINGAEKLDPTIGLSKVFADPIDEHLHVVVEAPKPDLSRLDKVVANSESDRVVQKRRAYLQNIGPKAPSTAGRPKEFRGQQANSDQLIYCNRPSHATTVIPVTLLHPVFGQFLDDKDMLEPTAPDNKLVREFSAVMAQIYDTEEERRAAILGQLRKWDIDLHGTTIEGTLYRTDADMQHKGDRYGLAEVKNEIGSKGAEPNAQATAYYLESTRRRAVDCPKSPLPCFLLYIFGPYIGFGGAAWNLRPTVQVLSTVLPLHFHYSDGQLRKATARHLAALRKAVRSLRDYYENTLPTINDPLNPSPPQAPYPYVTSFSSLKDLTKEKFSYLSQLNSDKLVFFGELGTGKRICVKFTQQYSATAHTFCASRGFAPTLHGFESLPGGWYMVVMDAIDDEYEELCEPLRTPEVLREIREKITQLHQAHHVHGDIRDANIMVRKDGKPGFMLVDFDWAGEIGKVRYPMNVNTSEKLWRPEGARDGELITADHDMQMLEYILSLYTPLPEVENI